MDNHLVRIFTDNNESRFDGTINADLNIAPGSEIALKSLYVEKENDVINIRTGQDTISYTFQDNADLGITYTITARLQNEEYDTNNFQSLLFDIQGSLNNGLSFYGAPTQNLYLLGMEFQANLNDDLKVQIEMGKANIGAQSELWKKSTDIINIEETGAGDDGVTSDVWYVNDVITDNLPRVMKIDERIPNGVGYLDAMLWQVDHDATLPANANSFYLCFSSTDLGVVTPEEIAANLGQYATFGVGIATTGTGYEAIQIKNAAVSSFVPSKTEVGFPTTGQTGNQRVRLQREGKEIYAVIQDAYESVDVTTQLIGTTGANTKLYPFIVFFTDESNIKLGQVQCSISHFSNETRTPALTLIEPFASAEDRPFRSTYTPPKGWKGDSGWFEIPDYRDTRNKLEFQSITLANFLGYEFIAHPRIGVVINRNFAAPAQFKFGPRIAVDELIVLAENLELNSYDTFAGQRKNILDIVGVDTANEGKVIYNADFPNFISLSNKDTRIMRNFKFRIVEKDYSTMQLTGSAGLVILIRSPKI